MRRIITLLFATCLISNLAFAQDNKAANRLLAMQLVEKNKVAIGIDNLESKNLLISDSYLDESSGIRYVYLQQQFKDIPVYLQLITLSFKNGKLLSKFGKLNPSMEKLVNTNSYSPSVSAIEAINLAVRDRGLSLLQTVTVKSTKDNGRSVEFSKNVLSDEPMTASLVWVPIEETINKEVVQTQMKLAWQVYFVPKVSSDYWSINVDANDGKILAVDNYTDYDQWGHKSPVSLPLFATLGSGKAEPSLMFMDKIQFEENTSKNRISPSIVNSATYRVVPFPAESPWAPGGSFANRTDPWLAAPGNATSLKWHTGLAGADFNYTRGNNVWAYEDRTAPTNTGTVAKSATSTTSPDPLTFVFVNDTTVDPTQRTPIPNQQFNTTNLFYWNNIIHDVMYQYGFNEASGNFQDDNQGRGGTGNDHVNAEAQDASGTNNANFSTPADGGSGRMQMFLWNINGSVPNKDGDVDNSIVVHEFGHGISNRLTGGPSNSGCLGNAEHMGEGWSDYYALMFTQNWATSTLSTGFNTSRGVGLYALNNVNLFPASPPGTGIRHLPYSTNFAVNNQVYLATLPSAVHDRGEIWCAALWEMTWEIINQVGTIDPNIYNATGTGGNVIAFKLVTEGLKLQQCSPGFISGRNAIIQADINLYGGVHVCAIRKAFAKRGMGTNASEGSTASVTDQIVDFSDGAVNFSFTQSGATGVPEGQNIVYTHNIDVTCTAIAGYTLRDTLPLNVTFVSATNGGTYNAGNRIVSWPVSIAAGASATYSLTVNINLGSYFVPNVILDEPVATTVIGPNWTPASTTANVWIAHNTRSNSAPNSFFSIDAAVNSDQTIATTNSFALGATPPNLKFWHRYATEANFDGCVVEISTNGGGAWADIGEANIIQNPYNSTISASFGSVLAGRRAWSGTIPGFVETIINMTPYANQANVKLRWRMASDNSVGGTGWNVDDINLLLKPVVVLKSALYDNLNAVVAIKDTITDILPAVVTCVTDPIVINNADAGPGSLRQAVLDACPGSTITFNMASVVSPIVLTSGEIILNKNLNILGPGSGLLTVSGNNNSRIFSASSGNTLSIKKLTFTAGNGVGATSTGRGGAIANAGAILTLDSVVMNANTASLGGALNTFTNGTSNVLNSTVSNNTSTSSGGAIQNFSGSFLNVTKSTFNGNTSNSGTGGGAIQANGTTTLTNSTFTGNTAGSGGDGGAITYNGTAMTVTNCTFANNSAADNGGAIYFTTSNQPTFLNTIIANNTATTVGQDVFGNVISQGYNLVGKSDGSTGFTDPTDLSGTIATPLNPLLGPLANNGGNTQTMALLATSPALDKGKAAVATDQTGTARPIDIAIIPNAAGGDGSDIGAYELSATAPIATATPAQQTICSGANIINIVLTSTESGTTYAWTRNNTATATGIAASGTGNISGSLTNTTAAAVTVTFSIIPTAGGIAGAAITATVVVQPNPTVNSVTSQAICNGASFAAVNFSGTPAGNFYNWTNSNPAIGLAASGMGNIPSFIGANAGTAPITATVTVTPRLNSAIFVSGSLQTGDLVLTGQRPARLGTASVCGTLKTFQGVAGAGPYFYDTYNYTNNTGAAQCVTVTNKTISAGNAFMYAYSNSFDPSNLATNYLADAALSSVGPNGLEQSFSFDMANGATVVLVMIASNTSEATPDYIFRVEGLGSNCTGTASTFTYTVNPTATVNAVTSQVVCNSAPTAAVNFTSPTTGGTITYNWTNSNTAIGLAAAGIGNIPSFTATNATNAPISATITVIPSYTNAGVTCAGTARTFTITVNPNATVLQAGAGGNIFIPGTLALTDPTYNRTLSYAQGGTCTLSGVGTAVHYRTHSFTLASAANITVSLVPADGASITPAGADTYLQLIGPGGFVPAVPCTNSIAANDDAVGALSRITTTTPLAPGTYTVVVSSFDNTPAGAGALPWTYSLAVLIPGSGNAPLSNQVVCNTSTTAAVNFATNATGGTTTYSWTNSNTSVGLAANGTGNIPAFLATNSGSAPTVATVTATASYTNAGVTCTGTPSSFTITVNPTATVTAVTNQVLCHNAASNAVNFSSPTTGGTITYNWTNNTTSIGLAASGSGNIPSFTATNTGAAPVTATITVTPTYANGGATCVGTASTFTITVNPLPTLTCPGNLTVTSTLGACTAAVTYTATITGFPTPTTTYTLSGATTGSGSGTGSGSLFNVGVTTVTITSVNTCATRTCSFTVTVNDAQLPVISSNPVNTSACFGTTATFAVTATNAVSYQWQRFINGTWTNVSGATSATLVLNNVTHDMNTYTYRVIAIGLCSSATSTFGTLTVNPLPSVSIVSSQTLLVPGSAFNLTAVSNPTGGSYVWYRDGVIISGVTGNTVAGGRIDDRATYKVVYTAPSGCVNTSADFVVGSLPTNNMYVYPNPNNGRFQIRFDNQINEAATVYIWNSLGQIVYTSKMNTGAIPYSMIDVNLNNMAAGVYVVKLINAAGREVGVTRIIIQ